MSQPVLLYIDPYADGHHAEYLGFFLRVCRELGIRLHAMVPLSVWESSAALAEDAAQTGQHVPSEDLTGASFSRRLRFLEEVASAARFYGARHIFFSTLDPLLPTLALRALWRKPFKISWSGLLFHDSFNFPEDERANCFARMKSIVRIACLRVALSKNATHLFTLNAAWRTKMPAPVVWLPDVLSSLDRIAEKASLDFDLWPIAQLPEKTAQTVRFLLFGILTPRKGLVEFCNVLLRLDPGLAKRVELRAMGKIHGPDHFVRELSVLFSELNKKGIAANLTGTFASEEQLDTALRWCDIVLAPYIDHVGSSGIINIAAQYGRPIVTQTNYQLGDEVRAYQLGIAVDPKNSEAFTKAIGDTVREGLNVTDGMDRYRRERRPELAFSIARDTIANAVCSAQ